MKFYAGGLQVEKKPPFKKIILKNDQTIWQQEKTAKAINEKSYFTRLYISQSIGSIENRNRVLILFPLRKRN